MDPRLPITPSILKQLIVSLPHTASSYFVHVCMKSMYLLAFYCFLRIGEFTASKDRNCHLLTEQSVHFSKDISDCSIGFELTMKHFKKVNLILCKWKVTSKITQYVPFRPCGHIFKLENQLPVLFLLSWMGHRCHGNILLISYVCHLTGVV